MRYAVRKPVNKKTEHRTHHRPEDTRMPAEQARLLSEKRLTFVRECPLGRFLQKRKGKERKPAQNRGRRRPLPAE